MTLKPGDIFFTHGEAGISKAIRWFSRSPGEPPTKANHVGIVVVGGRLSDAVVVEALSSVKRWTLLDNYAGKKDTVSIWRPINLKKNEREKIVKKAESYVGRRYGWGKIALHAFGLQRWAKLDKWPICSYLVGVAYGAADKHFGSIDNNELDPDDILDFCESHRDKYTEVMPWTQLKR